MIHKQGNQMMSDLLCKTIYLLDSKIIYSINFVFNCKFILRIINELCLLRVQLSNCPTIAMFTVQIPVVSMNDDGRVVIMSEEHQEGKDPVNKEKRKLTLSSIPFSLTSILHKKYILADPTAEEESIMETLVTVVLDSSGQLVSLYKPGGTVLAYTSAIQVSKFAPSS